MSFDVGIGKCRSISPDAVDVWVDGSVVRRIVPDSQWQRAGISILRIPLSLCSERHEVAEGEEVFIGSGLLGEKSNGLLDMLGNGEFVRIKLAPLIPEIDQDAPLPVARKTSWR